MKSTLVILYLLRNWILFSTWVSFYLLGNMFRHLAFIFFLWYDKSYENALSLTVRFTKSSLFFVNPYIAMHAQHIILFQIYILKAIRVTELIVEIRYLIYYLQRASNSLWFSLRRMIGKMIIFLFPKEFPTCIGYYRQQDKKILILETLVSSHPKIFSSQFHARSDAKDNSLA